MGDEAVSSILRCRVSCMNKAYFHFYAELNDFLPAERRGVLFPYSFKENPSVKHLIEALGVPHPEVQRILVNGKRVDFTYLVQPEDVIEVFPHSTEENSQRVESIPTSPEEIRFILDNHLGRLAAYLRMMGFDTLYRNSYQDEELARVSNEEDRILLTRDRRLLMRSLVRRGAWMRSQDPKQQLVEVIRRYHLSGLFRPFQRCLRCNHPLEGVSKEQVLSRLEPLTKLYYDEFHICPSCGQIYWKGSHFEMMSKFLEKVINRGRQP